MVFQDLLTTKDDYLRASRALLREIIKQTKHEINFQAFCLGLMQERKEAQYAEMEFKVALCLLYGWYQGCAGLFCVWFFSPVIWVTQFCVLQFIADRPYSISRQSRLYLFMMEHFRRWL